MHTTAKKNTFRARSKVIDLTEVKKKVPKKKGPPSKYMQEIIRLNLIEFVRKYKLKQTHKRIRLVIKVKKELQRRFLVLFKLFRLYKHGELFEDDKSEIPKEFQMPEELEFNYKVINNQLHEIEKYLTKKQN